MSDIKSEIVFPNSGLNSDDSLQWTPKGDGIERCNILVGEDGSNGLITQMLGNSRTVDISDHVLNLSHCYKVIGSYYNRLTRKVYYFIFSQPYEIPLEGTTTSTSTTTTPAPWDFDIDYTAGDFEYDNRLVCYNEDSQTLDLIFIDTRNYFGLDMNYPMRDLTMIGNWLYFNPRISEPKMIDVEMAYNYTNYAKYDETLTYAYGDFVTYYGGLFRAESAVGVGETPCNTIAKWDRVGDCYQDESSIATLDSEFRYAFNVIKSAPKDRIVCYCDRDDTINSNNVRGKLFRFTHRYKYFDNSYSVFSAYSDLCLPIEDENYDGEIIDDIQSNNVIKLDFTLHSSALIDSVEVYFQEIGESWRRCKTINRREQGLLDNPNNFTYDFYNNEAYEIYADPLAILKTYDAVPKLANSQEIINKNILCYGGVTEGFDNLPKEDIDVTLIPIIEDIEIPLAIDILRRDSIEAGGDIFWGRERDYYYTGILIGSWFPVPGSGVVPGDHYSFRIKVEGNPMYQGSLLLTAAILASDITLSNAIVNAMTASGLKDVYYDPSVGVHIEIRNDNFIYPVVFKSQFYKAGVDVTSLTKARGFKTGAFHPFCIFYYDEALRRWDAQTSKISEDASDALNDFNYEGTTVYIPMFNEISPVPADTARRWIIDWEVNHLPPVGAKYWRWGYAGNGLCSEFVQYIIGTEGITEGEGDAETNMLQIDITPLQTIQNTTELNWNQFPHSNINSYKWDKGDRIRFITEAPDDISVPGTRFGAIIDGVYDFEIIKQDDATNLIYIQTFDYAAVGLNGIGENSLVEIYTPMPRTEKLKYYEFGDLMPIIQDSAGVMIHTGEGSLHNQDSVTGAAAMGNFGAGDVYHILRTPSKPLCTNAAQYTAYAFHESQWFSDFYKSDEWDQGKPGIETIFNERKLNIVRHSNQYLQDTQINGLSTFEADSYKELNDVFGEIVAIYEVGDTLKVYMERKAASILIGRTEYNDAEGNVSVAISTSVLGAIRYSPSNYSTIFPESISRNNKFVYGFDIYNGVAWRDGVNGIFPISGRYAEAGGSVDYKMATYFKDKSKALMVSGVDHIDVMSVWDEEFKLLYITFVDYVLESNNETIVFHEPSNRWICFCDLEQTPTDGYNVMLELTYDIVRGFEGGLYYSFDEDTRFALFSIVTPPNIYVEPGGEALVLTAHAPTSVTCSADLSVTEETITLTSYVPSVHSSSTSLSESSMSWDYDEAGTSDAKTAIVTSTEASATVMAIPSWLKVSRDLVNLLSVGGIVYATDTLYLYPTKVNNGTTALSGTFTIQDSYGNNASITVAQQASATAPIISVAKDPTATAGLTISSANGSGIVGLPDISTIFTPDSTSYTYNQVYTLYWTILKNGTFAGYGSVSVHDEVANIKTVTMTSNIAYSDVIVVYISDLIS